MRSLILLAMLVLFLRAVSFHACKGLSLPGGPMPASGYIALGIGVVFSLVDGRGLMIFYSSRHGYDEPPHYRNDSRHRIVRSGRQETCISHAT